MNQAERSFLFALAGHYSIRNIAPTDPLSMVVETARAVRAVKVSTILEDRFRAIQWAINVTDHMRNSYGGDRPEEWYILARLRDDLKGL